MKSTPRNDNKISSIEFSLLWKRNKHKTTTVKVVLNKKEQKFLTFNKILKNKDIQ